MGPISTQTSDATLLILPAVLPETGDLGLRVAIGFGWILSSLILIDKNFFSRSR
jgi:hypothetical protein